MNRIKCLNCLNSIVALILVVLLSQSCLVLKITKDSKPLIDAGIPIVGHYRNGDTVKAVLYTILFSTSIIGIILFSPATEVNGKPVFGIPAEAQDAAFYSFIGTTAGTLTASSIDGAVTYHYVNNKIIALNNIEWQGFEVESKYDAITRYRDNEQKRLDDAKKEQYQEEISYYRIKLIDGSISQEEVWYIERHDILIEELAKELGHYYIHKDLQKNNEDKSMIDKIE